ncbi:MAG: PorT family protein [Prevotella sp.]|nr:PorT family protein [Prevotella sp.]
MKKIMMIAAMMIAAVSANAQNEVGQITLQPKAGINISTITGDYNDKKAKVGLVAGVEAEYGITENFGIDFGVLYSMEGCKMDLPIAAGEGASVYLAKGVNINLDYINIPILAQYYPVKGLAIKAGIQPAFNVRHKASKDGDKVNIDGVKSFNFSIPVGLSYEYASFVLDARYNIGVTKLFKDADQGRNSTFSITIGYKFAL